MEKNSDPARAMVRRVSPATEQAWATASRANGDASGRPPAAARTGLRSGRQPASWATNGSVRPLKSWAGPVDICRMADLSDLLGDVYGPLAPADPDGPSVPHEPPASQRTPAVPEWASDERLDAAF